MQQHLTWSNFDRVPIPIVYWSPAGGLEVGRGNWQIALVRQNVTYSGWEAITATQLISTSAFGRISSVTPTAVHAG